MTYMYDVQCACMYMYITSHNKVKVHVHCTKALIPLWYLPATIEEHLRYASCALEVHVCLCFVRAVLCIRCACIEG